MTRHSFLYVRVNKAFEDLPTLDLDEDEVNAICLLARSRLEDRCAAELTLMGETRQCGRPICHEGPHVSKAMALGNTVEWAAMEQVE